MTWQTIDEWTHLMVDRPDRSDLEGQRIWT